MVCCKSTDMVMALAHRRPATAVPVWELSFQAWDAASGEHVVLGQEFEQLSPGQQERALHRNAQIMAAVCRQMHHAALSVPGAYWYQSPGELAYYVMPGDTRFRQAEILRQYAGDDLMLIGTAGAIMQSDYSEDFCFRMFDAPQSIDEQAERKLHGGIETAKRLRDCGVRAVVSASDIADNSGPFFNPQQMERWIYPYLARWAQAIREMGLFSILHSDGQFACYLDRIADTGIDALQAIDPVAGMDMLGTRRVVGDRLCLCGNVDCGLLLTGTPQQVHAAARLLDTCKADGGLVLGASNAVQAETPIENYRAMIAAWRVHGQYDQPSKESDRLVDAPILGPSSKQP